MPAKLKPLAEAARPIDTGVRIGHVHLKVADLDRALGFYTGVLGFELMQRYGNQAAFLSRPAAIIITSASTPGKAAAARRRRPAPPGSITSRSSIRTAPRSPRRCSGSLPRTSRSTARATTA